MTDEEAREHANKIVSAAQNAAGDVGYQQEEEYRREGRCFCDEKATEFFEKTKAAGCRDLGGSYADSLYSDPGFIQDMIGDRVYEAGKDDNERGRILLMLRSMMGDQIGWKEAIQKLIERNGKWIAHAMVSGAPIT